jgi:hypothetical protein
MQNGRSKGARKRLYFPVVEIRLGLAALFAVVLQLAAIFAPLGEDDLPRRVLMLTSYGLLLVFVAANFRHVWIAVLGAGILLNFLVIAANGGLMPITPETLERTGGIPEGVQVGEWVPDSKDVLLSEEDARLYLLSDRIVWEGLGPVRAFSVGDVVIVGGLVIFLASLFMPRIRDAGDSRYMNSGHTA